MAVSLGQPLGQPSGGFTHALSGSRMRITSGSREMRHRLEQGGLRAEYAISYFVGSGNRGRSYLINIDGYLFQSPASYYTATAKWAPSPGYEGERELDFERPIIPECLFCHAGRARPIRSTLNRYESPPFEAEAITCERCHGPPGRHLENPSADTIINPAKLPPVRRDAVCEQCHLGGEARVLSPGREPWDFQPGDLLEDVFSVYVFERPPESEGHALKVVSHSEQLAASRCAQQSGEKMWCGSCHSPHNKPDDPVAYYRQRCQECHNAASLASHRKPVDDCAGCHMPRRQTYDGAHTAFTDHQIRRRPSGEGAPLWSRQLRPWREPDARLVNRNLGLAHVSVGDRDQSVEHFNEGFRLLAGVESSFATDTAVLTSVGAVLQKKGVLNEAAKRFLRASELEPDDARHQLNLAIVRMEGGENAAAISGLQKAISLDPSLLDAYLLLAEIHKNAGHADESRHALERYLKFMPQSLLVRRLLQQR
jgi:tetratricopeptide (TPR) repeat protein